MMYQMMKCYANSKILQINFNLFYVLRVLMKKQEIMFILFIIHL